MLKHYKKLIVLLIVLAVGFFLSLALGSAEEPCELCQLCQNKALVKEAILAINEYPYSRDFSNLPEQFDPNYGQWGPTEKGLWIPPKTRELLHPLHPDDFIVPKFTFDDIIAEGDKVSVRVSWSNEDEHWTYYYFEQAIYRIANGKIVEGWVHPALRSAFQSRRPLEEPYEMCQLCQNKKLVKEAILAFDEDSYYSNLPEHFDPNYVQHGPFELRDHEMGGRSSGVLTPLYCGGKPSTFECILAEGDMVSVLVSCPALDYRFDVDEPVFQMAIYRIANGKIVEAWISDLFSGHTGLPRPYWN